MCATKLANTVPSQRAMAVLAPTAGLNTNAAARLIADGEMSDCNGVMVQEGQVKTIPGASALGNALESQVKLVDGIEFMSGDKHLLAVSGQQILRYDESSQSWQPLSAPSTVDDCENNWTSGGPRWHCALDSDHVEGEYCLLVWLEPYVGGNDWQWLLKHDIGPLDLHACGYVSVWINRVFPVRSMANYAIFLSESTTDPLGAAHVLLELPVLDDLPKDQWVCIMRAVDLSDLDAVVCVGLASKGQELVEHCFKLDCIGVGPLELESTPTDWPSSCMVRDMAESDYWWIYTDGENDILKWDGSNDPQALIGSYPPGMTSLLAKYATEFKQHLLLGYTIEDGNEMPQRVRWSETADPDNFSGDYALYVDLPGPEAITGLSQINRDTLLVARSASMWVGRATGDTDVFSFSALSCSAGCSAGRTIKVIADKAIFLAYSADNGPDVLVTDGYSVQSVAGPILPLLRDLYVASQIHNALAMTVPELGQYWLFLPNADGLCDNALILRTATGAWTKARVPAGIKSASFYCSGQSKALGQYSQRIGELDIRIGDTRAAQGTPVPVLAGDLNSTYRVWQLDSSIATWDDQTLDHSLTTKAFAPIALTGRWRIQRMDFWYRGGPINVQAVLDDEVSSVYLGQLEQSAGPTKASIFRLVEANNIALVLSGDGAWSFEQARVYWMPSGRRLR